ncbi:conserved exported hypothetical protein [uncultured Mycobacterium sp.]|uniref:Lipoprotein n=1 Tax=uncultured Mycobacterium sp. TaxID=171292 RepID=A0A1Y5NWJ4_9MYCO|nr:conserved exported hypothetical protein [uncultured Mycobacterium sp.]
MIVGGALAVAVCAASVGVAAADPTTTPAPAPAPTTSDAPTGPAPGPTSSTASPTPTPSSGAPSSPAPTPAPAGGPKSSMDSDGTYKVGVDIVPGTYATAGPVEGGACYWKRVGGPDGQTNLDNGITKKPQIQQIDPGDATFKTDGCQPWTLTDAQPPAAPGPLMSQLQLRHYLDQLNGMSGASGNGQLPPY